MSGNKIKINELLTPAEFRELSQPNDLTAASHLILRIAVHAALLWAMVQTWFSGHIVASLLIAYANAVLWQFIGYAGIGHELFHKKVFKNRNLNEVLYKFASYATWSNPAYFSESHSLHHRSTFDEKDSEIYRDFPATPFGIARLLLLDYQGMYRRILYAIFNSFGYEIQFRSPIQLRPMPANRRAAQTDARAMILVNTIWLALFFMATGSFNLTLIVFLTPFIGVLPNRILALTQHVGLDHHKDDGALLFSRTLNLPTPIAFFYANMNYHAEHHLLPSIPYYNLPKLHKILNAKLHTNREEKEFPYVFGSEFWREVISLHQENNYKL